LDKIEQLDPRAPNALSPRPAGGGLINTKISQRWERLKNREKERERERESGRAECRNGPVSSRSNELDSARRFTISTALDTDAAASFQQRPADKLDGRGTAAGGKAIGIGADADRGARANPRRSLARSDCSNEGDNAMTRVGIIDPVCDRSCDLANADARFPR
jgi:hypothetical protein